MANGTKLYRWVKAHAWSTATFFWKKSWQSLQGKTIRKCDAPAASIAICIQGGLGDHIIALGWIQALYKFIPEPIRVDVYGRIEMLDMLLNMQSCISNYYSDSTFDVATGYDLKLHIFHFIDIIHVDMIKVRRKSKRLQKLVKERRAFRKKYSQYHSNKYGNALNAWADFCIKKGYDRWAKLGAESMLPFGRESGTCIHLDTAAFSRLTEFDLNQREYITLHNGVDTSFNSALHPKIWPLSHWESLCHMLKKAFPEITLVQVGGGSVEKIPGVDVCLVNKMTFTESAAVLKYSLLHIDVESGLVHLRRTFRKKSIVLFGPTPIEHFAYPENDNLHSGDCPPCMWMTPNWMVGCIRGTIPPECMAGIKPERVFETAAKFITAVTQYRYSWEEPELYASTAIREYEQTLDDIISVCKLQKKPIQKHIVSDDRLCYIHASKQWEYPYVLKQILPLGDVPLKIADVGGGRGALSLYLAKKGHNVHLFDISYMWDDPSDPSLEKKFLNNSTRNKLHVNFGSVFNIPVEDNFFDIVTCISVLEHVPHKELAIQELLRVLKPGGKLILTYDLVVDENYDADAIRVEVFTPRSLAQCLNNVGIDAQEIHLSEDVIASMDCVKNDNLKVTVKNLTFGALTIRKFIADGG